MPWATTKGVYLIHLSHYKKNLGRVLCPIIISSATGLYEQSQKRLSDSLLTVPLLYEVSSVRGTLIAVSIFTALYYIGNLLSSRK